MIIHSKILLSVFAVTFCLCALVISPVSAEDRGQQMENRLALFEEQGIDVTEIRAALESGDTDTAHSLLAELCDKGRISFGEDHEIPSEGAECGRDRIGELKRRDLIERYIVIIEEQGIDTAEIRHAFVFGDLETVHALIKTLPEEGPFGDGDERSRGSGIA